MDDDYLTQQANGGDKFAKELLKIEDASEKFKVVMHKKGVIESILKELPGPHKLWEGTKGKINTVKPTDAIYMYISLKLSDGGHFASAYAHGNVVYVFDSMCSSCGPHNDYKYFERVFKKMKPGHEIKLVSSNGFYQPSGGFCAKTREDMNNLMLKTLGHNRNVDLVFHLHQFDTMSQHHFCYIEALVFLFHAAFGTPIGPKNDPDERLVFIKKVGWGLLEMFGKSKMKPGKFSEYMKIENTKFNKGLTLPMRNMPKFVIKHINLPTKKKNIPDLIHACV